MTFMMEALVATNGVRMGRIVRDVRRAQKITQADLARKACVSRGWLIRLEKGHPTAELDRVLKVLSLLGCDVVVREREAGPNTRAHAALLSAMLGEGDD